MSQDDKNNDYENSEYKVSRDLIQHSKDSIKSTRDSSWIERVWAWADEFALPEDVIPRSQHALLAITELEIESSHPQNFNTEGLSKMTPAVKSVQLNLGDLNQAV